MFCQVGETSCCGKSGETSCYGKLGETSCCGGSTKGIVVAMTASGIVGNETSSCWGIIGNEVADCRDIIGNETLVAVAQEELDV
ncbi:hypothetical protein V6N11_049775 [Hibiscus sabdariffa]|uniref:Uncharacterized protein n=1 Tax=Hibiscus sabdariffa TaxID=183260 RepID=A0ABR2T7W7_9ROSI